MPHNRKLLLRTFVYFFAEAEANQTQIGKLHSIGLISYPIAACVSPVALKIKYDFH